jgi:hypothetical protein
LRKSKFNTLQDIAAFTQRFDEGLKRVYSGDAGLQYVKFGAAVDYDPEHGIKGGRLTLTGYPLVTPTHSCTSALIFLPASRKDVAGFFEPSIRSTVNTVRENFMKILPKNSVCTLESPLMHV